MAKRLGMMVCLLALGGCGDDEGAGASGGGPELQTCFDVCEAQDAAEMAGNCPGVGLDVCRALCRSASGSECWTELTASNACQLTGQFDCGLFSAESDADCETEFSAYQDCAVEASNCTGADDEGFCPSIFCPCPEGDIRISGFTNDASGCACVDSVTCLDLC